MLEKLIGILRSHQEDQKRFFTIVRANFAYASPGMRLIEEAYQIAESAHQGQFRDSGEAYIEHPKMTAAILLEYLGVTDPVDIAAALNHDTPEDNSEDWPINRIHERLCREVAEAVDWCNRRRFDYIQDPRARDFAFFNNLLMVAPFRPVRIKLADQLHNGMTPWKLDNDAWVVRKCLDIREHYIPMARKHGGILQHELAAAATALEARQCLLPPLRSKG